MEIITFFIIISILVAFIANDPMQTPFGAIFTAGVVAFFAFIGGASFLNQLIIAIQERSEEQSEDAESPGPSLLRLAGHGPAEFDTYDKFYHAYGICCGERGHCHSCLTQYAEQFRKEHVEDGHEFDRQFKHALAE
ncbi:hypothetical protein FPOAC2_11284 [Fusarium poae]|uniref:hypothetical protein n=1 Tax=Fusarium poae TaxID=36050 RepID=UPI001CEA8FCF|nr:hypothetical protein FPOAC1_010989 [Fusarium poae]KAG8666186.1 hypothetical protein FPOAC1_010989 [Fusarium poae]